MCYLFWANVIPAMETKYIFNRKSKLDTEGKGLIELQIYLSRTKRPMKSTQIWIEPKYWDTAKAYLSKKHPSYDFINAQLIEFKSRVERLLIEQKVRGGSIDLSQLDGKPERYFFEFFENDVMKVSNADLSEGTAKIYNRTLKYLREYSNDIPMDRVNVSWLEGFNKFMIESKGLHVNTRATLMRKVKKAINLAISNDLIPVSQSPFQKGFTINSIEPEKKSLTLKELNTIEQLDMSLRPELDKTRDMFLFACYTALRYGDLVTLTYENFEMLDNGNIRIQYTPGKTKSINNKVIRWILSDFWGGKADAIIKKHFEKNMPFRDHPAHRRRFFDYSNSVYNENLKELQRFAGIHTTLISHLARHTCITLLINDFGLDITKAQLIAGHSKIEMTQKYLRITEQDLSAAAKKINW